MDVFPHPARTATSDEVSTSDPKMFGACEQAMDAFARRGGGTITERKYSISKEWGRVLRAKVSFARNGVAGTMLVTCWTGAGPGVQMAVEVEGCGPQQAGC